MGAYTYCMHCSHGIGAPTLPEVLRGELVCPGCARPLRVRNDPEDVADAAQALIDRVEDLERKLAALLPPAPPRG